ncbi:hypothetical protein O1611_g8451 [Lasiodiplodia mahajangana]|uniref:Uncharacterized protein n=1 Tax=Lasiodiplodia mahajangana TaxID=1108764 RepID=A0ACC2JCI9_9PEZI|nr:hypothetical protein O1611_g8451 [Lasiodiplodia mahajangana]
MSASGIPGLSKLQEKLDDEWLEILSSIANLSIKEHDDDLQRRLRRIVTMGARCHCQDLQGRQNPPGPSDPSSGTGLGSRRSRDRLCRHLRAARTQPLGVPQGRPQEDVLPSVFVQGARQLS